MKRDKNGYITLSLPPEDVEAVLDVADAADSMIVEDEAVYGAPTVMYVLDEAIEITYEIFGADRKARRARYAAEVAEAYELLGEEDDDEELG